MTPGIGGWMTAAVVCGALAGCVPAGLFDFEVTPEAERADWPGLYTGAAAPRVKPAGVDEAAPLEEAGADLAARAAALRARAAAMAGPVLPANDPARRAFGG